MTIQRMDHVGIVVEDLAAAIGFFVALGLELQGEGSVEGREVDRIVGLDGVRSEIAFLRTPDGHSQIELARFHSPPAPRSDRNVPANTPGLRHVTFAVEDVEAVLARLEPHGAELVGELESYGGYLLCYVRGPEGIIVELAEKTG
jgi:catechol 2,3-dioxygenase-like lactoylglutathione lyase family enzyme